MAVRSLRGAAAIAAALTFAFAGCGGGDDGSNGGTGSDGQPAKVEEFPSPAGKTLAQIREGLGPGPVLAPAVSVLHPGENRFSFGLFDRSRRQIAGTPTVIYAQETDGRRVIGPFPAAALSLDVKPAFRSQTVSNDPDAAQSIYVTHVKFPKPGDYEILGVARLDDRLVAADPVGVRVTEPSSSGGRGSLGTTNSPVPEVGAQAPKIVTPTRASTGGDLAGIDTRVPPGTMHEDNFAQAVGQKPVMLLFATPALCQSRVCGPVVDIAEEVKAEHKDDGVAWIHMEIYNDNEPQRGVRQQVATYGLPSEPWLFAIDRSGRIVERLEGAYSKSELEKALAAAERR